MTCGIVARAGDGLEPRARISAAMQRCSAGPGGLPVQAEPAVDLGQHPRGSDQQVDQVGQETRLAALELVADELRDPGNDVNNQGS